MIIASRIPALTKQMRLATLRAAGREPETTPLEHLIEELRLRGHDVKLWENAA